MLCFCSDGRGVGVGGVSRQGEASPSSQKFQLCICPAPLFSSEKKEPFFFLKNVHTHRRRCSLLTDAAHCYPTPIRTKA